METTTRTPGGRKGLPLLGETLEFAKNPFRFIDTRLAEHRGIFRTNILGRDAVVIAGPEAAGQLIDDENVMREGSMPPHVQQLFGGRSLPLLDGADHRARKSIVLQAFTREALEAYLPQMQAAVDHAFARWTAQGEIVWLDELKRLAIEMICSTILGLAPGEEMNALRRDYDVLTGGFAALPVNLPGTKFHRALRARDRIFAVLRRHVQGRRAEPRSDGLSRILQARASDGTMLDDDAAVLELHHLVIAGFIVYAELAATVTQLTNHPAVRERLAKEIASRTAGPLSTDALGRLHYLMQVIMEVKRMTPIVPAVFGRARRSFAVGDKDVASGSMVMWAITPSHATYGVYSDPENFDPDRFSRERAEEKRHEHAFAPQGAGPVTGHRCPGVDFATWAMAVFTVSLLDGHTWELPPQEMRIDYARTPPGPRDGLRAQVRRV